MNLEPRPRERPTSPESFLFSRLLLLLASYSNQAERPDQIARWENLPRRRCSLPRLRLLTVEIDGRSFRALKEEADAEVPKTCSILSFGQQKGGEVLNSHYSKLVAMFLLV